MFEIENLNRIKNYIRDNQEIYNVLYETSIIYDFSNLINKINSTKTEGFNDFNYNFIIKFNDVHSYEMNINISFFVFYKKYFFFKKKKIYNHKMVIINVVNNKTTINKYTDIEDIKNKYNRIFRLVEYFNFSIFKK